MHSPETAILKIYKELRTVRSRSKEGTVVVLIMLDLTAVFDTIDHTFLLSRLHEIYGIHDQVLVRINSYLSDKLQKVNIKGTPSDTQKLSFVVPVLGPILYCIVLKSKRNVNLLERAYRLGVLQLKLIIKLKVLKFYLIIHCL